MASVRLKNIPVAPQESLGPFVCILPSAPVPVTTHLLLVFSFFGVFCFLFFNYKTQYLLRTKKTILHRGPILVHQTSAEDGKRGCPALKSPSQGGASAGREGLSHLRTGFGGLSGPGTCGRRRAQEDSSKRQRGLQAGVRRGECGPPSGTDWGQGAELRPQLWEGVCSVAGG